MHASATSPTKLNSVHHGQALRTSLNHVISARYMWGIMATAVWGDKWAGPRQSSSGRRNAGCRRAVHASTQQPLADVYPALGLPYTLPCASRGTLNHMLCGRVASVEGYLMSLQSQLPTAKGIRGQQGRPPTFATAASD